MKSLHLGGWRDGKFIANECRTRNRPVWTLVHHLRALRMSIALEVAELMERTQWAKHTDLPALAIQHRDTLAEEMADIAILRLYPEPAEGYLAHDLDLDLGTAVRQKLKKNAAKYPVEKAKGVATKYDRL